MNFIQRLEVYTNGSVSRLLLDLHEGVQCSFLPRGNDEEAKHEKENEIQLWDLLGCFSQELHRSRVYPLSSARPQNGMPTEAGFFL